MAIDHERTKRVIDVLQRRHLDAFLGSLASGVLLLTGYWPVMAVNVAAFTADGDVQITLREDEIHLAEKTTEATLIPFKLGRLDQITNPIQALVTPLGSLTATVGVPFEQKMQPASYAVPESSGLLLSTSSSVCSLPQRIVPAMTPATEGASVLTQF